MINNFTLSLLPPPAEVETRQILKQLNLSHRHLAELPKIYSQDLLNNLFKNPYTKIEFLEADLNVTRRTAQNYLDAITEIGLLEKLKIGKTNYYINEFLIKVLIGEKV